MSSPAAPLEPRAGLSRWGLAGGVLVLAALIAEGAVSLLKGASLFGSRTVAVVQVPAVMLATDQARLAAGRSAKGELRGHVDPRVGIALRGGARHATGEATFSARPDGVRGRSAPPPKNAGLKVVILGDSVAFGYGVGDDQTIAHQLEQILAEVRGPDVSPIVASTVAVPGWNHRNAVHFLIDHMQRLDPDIVVYLPVENDLTDTFGVTEGGHRALLPDASEPDPWLSVHDEPLLAFIFRSLAAAQARDGSFNPGDSVGPRALTADLTAESRRRYDAAADSIALLDRILTRIDARLALAFIEQNPYGWTLQARLSERDLELPVVPLYSRVPKAFRLPADPHPSAEGLGYVARWIAEDLLERGWIDKGADRRLAPLPEGATLHRAERMSPEAVVSQARQSAAAALELLQPRIDLTDGQGVHQVYAGLNQDGSMSSAFAGVVAGGTRVEVALAPLEELPHLYPLRVLVALDGVSVGEVLLQAQGEMTAVFERPQGIAPESPIEVRLSPELWGVALKFGRSHVASCRLRFVRSLP